MRLEGSLDAFSLPDIFSLLSMTKKTGGLHLRRAGDHGAVWLADGLLTGGASDVTRESLGRRLAGCGQVDDEALNDAVARLSADGSLGVARVMRDAKVIDEGALHTMVSEQIIDAVFDLMRWPDGVFEFVVDEPNLDDVGVTREVEEAVTEARHRMEIWDGIDPTVAHPGTVVSLALDPGADPQLTREEWGLIALVDGSRTVGDLVAMCGRGQYNVVVALADLATRGLLRANDAEGVARLARRQELLATLDLSAPTPPPAALRSVEALPAAAAADADAATEPSSTVPDAEPAAAGPFDVPTPTPSPTPAAASAALMESAAAELHAIATDDDDEEFEPVERLAEVSQLNRNVDPAVPINAVTPHRPEPIVATREPEHPAPLAAAAGGGVVASAVPAPNPAGVIERDPSVNKSLLLRLIAGVRGL